MERQVADNGGKSEKRSQKENEPTALMEAFCMAFRERYDIRAITNDIYIV
jgi:hypothetical protein